MISKYFKFAMLLALGTTMSFAQPAPLEVPFISPAGGATLHRGQTFEVKWDVENIPPKFNEPAKIWLIVAETGKVYPPALAENVLLKSGKVTVEIPTDLGDENSRFDLYMSWESGRSFSSDFYIP
ncbi:hypothetical protein JVU11DRAFT_8703 [Chiua virens]|nr:hypothetical protein JVU11DRAFT_8703 [Chiua virens]